VAACCRRQGEKRKEEEREEWKQGEALNLQERVEELDERNGGLSFLFPAFLYFERKVPRVAPNGEMPV